MGFVASGHEMEGDATRVFIDKIPQGAYGPSLVRRLSLGETRFRFVWHRVTDDNTVRSTYSRLCSTHTEGKKTWTKWAHFEVRLCLAGFPGLGCCYLDPSPPEL